MKNLLIKISILFFLLSNSNLFSSINNKILVRVNNEIISSFDLKNQINTILFLTKKQITQQNINSTKKIALNNLISINLKKTEISKLNINIDKKNIYDYLLRISGGDVENFKNRLQSYNIDYNTYINNIETELNWQQLIVSKFQDKININESEIESLLLNEKNKILTEYNLSKIEIFLNEKENIDEQIKNIKRKLTNTNFNDIMNKLVDSNFQVEKSELGWINQKSLSKNIVNKINKLQINSFTQPIAVTNSILILKVNDKKNTNINEEDIDNLKKMIVNQKRSELFSLYSKNYLSKLKSNALIEFNE